MLAKQESRLMNATNGKNPQKQTVLVVDDAPAMASLIMDILDSAGYEVIHASEGKSAVKMALKEKPQLVLLDIIVPEMDGIEVCRAIRTHPQTSYLKIIMVTCLNNQKSYDDAMAAGASEYVVKPFTKKQLLETVRTVLDS